MKQKTINEIVKLSQKQWRSWLSNSNTNKPVKFWLDEYVNQLSVEDRNTLIMKLCDRIYELDKTLDF